jgi:hypothetical protein
LLKANSKRVPQDRKRRKIDLLGSFEQFKQSTKVIKQEEPGMITNVNEENKADQ